MVGSGGDNAIAVASGANLLAQAKTIPDALLGSDTLVLCQMEVPSAENWSLLRRARAAGSRTMLNLAPAAPIPTAVFPAIDILVANESEAVTLGRNPGAVAGGLGEALVVTRGAAGSTTYLRDGGRIDIPAMPIDAVDTTGAGDTFTGVLAAGLGARLTLPLALRRASAAAALACQRHGAQTAMPERAAIEAAIAAWEEASRREHASRW
jgi:ribokinase